MKVNCQIKTITILIITLLLWTKLSLCQQSIEIDSLQRKVGQIEEIIEQMRSEKRASDYITYVFGGLVTLIGIVLTIRQVLDKRESNKYFELIKQQSTGSEKVFQWQKESNSELINHVTKNMEASTRMINSMSNMIDLQETATDFKTTIENEKNRFRNRTLDLNKESIRVYQNIQRKDFHSVYFDNAIRGVHDKVQLQISSNPNESEEDYTSSITPTAYWLSSLHSFKKYQYADCKKSLESTIKKCLEGLTNPNNQEYDSALVFPDEKGIITQNGGRDEWVKKILNQAYFIYGLVDLNQGKYKDATERFNKALEFNRYDFETQLLSIQSTYFSEEGNFEAIVNKFEVVKEILNSVSASEKVNDLIKKSISIKLNLLNGYTYFPIRNESVKNPFASSRNPVKAYKLLNEAFNMTNSPEIGETAPMIYYLTSASAAFSYSQILKELRDNSTGFHPGPSKSEYNQKIKELNEKVISLGSVELQNTQRDNLEMNFYINYMISISQLELSIPIENSIYFTHMKSYLKMFESMNSFKIFSPHSKTFLNYQLTQEEINKLFKKINS